MVTHTAAKRLGRRLSSSAVSIFTACNMNACTEGLHVHVHVGRGYMCMYMYMHMYMWGKHVEGQGATLWRYMWRIHVEIHVEDTCGGCMYMYMWRYMWRIHVHVHVHVEIHVEDTYMYIWRATCTCGRAYG